MADNISFTCNLCPFITSKFPLFQNHYVRNHKHHPNFYVACCIGSCAYSTRSWACYRVHVHRMHRNVEEGRPVQVDNIASDSEDDDLMEANNGSVADSTRGKQTISPANFTAMFTLSLAAKHNMSQTAIDGVVSSASNLVESHINYFKQQVKTKLSEMHVSADVIDDIPVETFFSEFDSHTKRQTFYRKNLETLIEPQKVMLGRKFVYRCEKISKSERIGYIIPFERSLQNLLSMPEIWHYVQNSHQSVDKYMWDVCDGEVVGSNPDLLKSLQIILNCDDMEIVNPLGSHIKKHKISMFYFSLANIPPEYRSKTDVIQLLAVAKAQDVHQNDAECKLLSDFCSTMQRLSTDGIDMTLHGRTHTVRGNLVVVCADTLASNWIGKFKEGVSFALRMCRQCEVEKMQASIKFVERDVVLRTLEEHKDRCDMLAQLSRDARKYWSRIWGINGASCLLTIDAFDITSGLVQDPMHVLLEGVLPRELSLVLYYFIYVKKIFSLKWLNVAITGFRYSYLHCKSKPELIDRQHLNGKGTVKQTASAMLTLVHTLPFLIGHRVPENDANWLNTLRLLQIVLFATASYCSHDTPAYLRILIAEYLHNFKKLYPRASFIPKMHFMLHLPSQMVKYGPLRHHWCMRFEGKNGFFANKKYKNFINLPLTLAKRHQLYMAYVQSGCENGRSGTFLCSGDQVENGDEDSFSARHPSLVSSLKNYTKSETDIVYMTTSVTIHGLQYSKGCALVIAYSEDDEPLFGILHEVVVVDHTKYFIIDKLVTVYNLHILSYVIKTICERILLSFQDLKFKWPLSVYTFKGERAVMNVNSHTFAFPF